MNAANALTIVRLALAPVFVLLLRQDTVLGMRSAAAVFTLAALTDTVDGWLARRTGTITRFGRAADPLADKLLVALALGTFVTLGVPGVAAWMVVAIVAREVLVTALRSFASRRGVPVPVSRLGKWKTTFQMTFVFLWLGVMVLRARADVPPPAWRRPGDPWEVLLAAGFAVTVGITIASGLDYAWRTRAVFARRGPR
jgi:CDP-diacylglycerol---glycerol-3-phosphate 3-phosphatidyltransferase